MYCFCNMKQERESVLKTHIQGVVSIGDVCKTVTAYKDSFVPLTS